MSMNEADASGRLASGDANRKHTCSRKRRENEQDQRILDSLRGSTKTPNKDGDSYSPLNNNGEINSIRMTASVKDIMSSDGNYFKYDDSRGSVEISAKDALVTMIFNVIINLGLLANVARSFVPLPSLSLLSSCSEVWLSYFKEIQSDCSESSPRRVTKSRLSSKTVSGHLRVTSWLLLALVCASPCSSFGKPISETLQRAYANSRGPSPGAKKLLNIPEDGGKNLSYFFIDCVCCVRLYRFSVIKERQYFLILW